MIRINSGELKGKNISVPRNSKTRPVTSKMRETFFNLLGSDIRGMVMLDLFAGSGIMGFEAISNGAEKCFFVENSEVMIEFLYKNSMNLDVKDSVRIIRKDAFSFLRNYRPSIHFNLIFADPPYENFNYPRLLEEIFSSKAREEDSLVFIKAASAAVKQLQNFSFRRYGSGDVNLLKF
ncbi:MAG TPA: 16S rRNA (guanine(966)-N(2))-methyltransferase RsmD [Firmicutes bacterium]|nr:16S rRNA (guanine(966)-N(2))-methyltransferase RsmD [Bacillota bacterium]